MLSSRWQGNTTCDSRHRSRRQPGSGFLALGQRSAAAREQHEGAVIYTTVDQASLHHIDEGH
jgi:hypothetical protein